MNEKIIKVCKDCGHEVEHRIHTNTSYMPTNIRIESFRTCAKCCKEKRLGVIYKNENFTLQQIYNWARELV